MTGEHAQSGRLKAEGKSTKKETQPSAQQELEAPQHALASDTAVPGGMSLMVCISHMS